MQKYEVRFTVESEFSVTINAESVEQAIELVRGSATPATCIDDAEGVECEPDFQQSDVAHVFVKGTEDD